MAKCRTDCLFVATVLFSTVTACVQTPTNSMNIDPAAADRILAAHTVESEAVVAADDSFLAVNNTYGDIASRVLSRRPLGSIMTLQAARLNGDAHDRERLPKLTPSASVQEDGDGVVRLQLDQTLYTSGSFQAERRALNAATASATVEHLIAASTRVADTILLYLEATQHAQTADVHESFETRYAQFVSQARRRLDGGIGDRTEMATFELKWLESRLQKERSLADARVARAQVRELTGGLSLPEVPPDITLVAPRSEALDILQLYAVRAETRAQRDRVRSRQYPTITLEAYAEKNLADGRLNDGVSLGVGVPVALGFRNALDVKAANAELGAVELEIESTRRDLESTLAQINARIARDTSQRELLKELLAASAARVSGFDREFSSGTVSFAEAVSVLETYKRAQLDLLANDYGVRRDQVELARLSGQLAADGSLLESPVSRP